MRLLYDHQIFDMQRVGGVSRYFVELIKNLPTEVTASIPIKYTVNQYLKDTPALACQISTPPDYYTKFMGGRVFKGKKRLYNLKRKYFPEPSIKNYNKELTIAALKKGDFDLFHPTYYDDYFLDYIGSKPFILTVYDMIHEIFPEYFMNNKNNRTISQMKRNLLRKASGIIAISANTKKDIISLCGINEDKIAVTHLGNSLPLKDSTSLPDELPKKYLLFIGSRDNYKNFYFFIHAIHLLLEQDHELCIVCTGNKFTDEEKEFISALNLTNRIIHRFVDDISLAHLYKNAQAFVFPSLYEGFGIPVLEAFRCGCPALLSNTSSLPEVGGDAAIYFDPKSAFSIREAVKQVLYDEEKRRTMIIKGFTQLEKFSWSTLGLSTYHVYKRVLYSS
jgi:glycosyltransferase involved in cell wall biosynthesis